MNGRALRLRITPSPWQSEVLEHPARFLVVAGGRRVGKSFCMILLCLRLALSKPDSNAICASPVYSQSRARFREFVGLVRREAADHLASVNRSTLRVEFVNGSAVTFTSAYDADRTRGEGADLVVLDEAGFIEAPTFWDVYRPMLSDRLGRALVIGSPRGRGQLLHLLYERGQSAEADWASWRLPTSANPRIAASELEAARRELPEDSFRQEYLAEFLDAAAGVFRHVERSIGGELGRPVQGRPYVLGADLAREHDFTALVVIDVAARQVVHVERIRKLDYVRQVQRIVELASEYNHASQCFDETGVGAAVGDMLRRTEGVSLDPTKPPRAGGLKGRRQQVIGVTLSAQTKADVIDRLRLELERGRIRIPKECTELLQELRLYSYSMTPSGRVTYSAPSGFHDDLVIALALAVYALPHATVTLDHIPARDRLLIEDLRWQVSRPQRYGLGRTFGLGGFDPGWRGDLHAEMRLLQVCERAGLVTREEAPHLARDLRRRILESGLDRVGYSDPLDGELGTFSEFLERARERRAPDDAPESPPPRSRTTDEGLPLG